MSRQDSPTPSTHVTMLRFSGGQTIEVALRLEEVRELLQDALARGVLLELAAPDGDTIVINPQQVQFLQNGSLEPFPASDSVRSA